MADTDVEAGKTTPSAARSAIRLSTSSRVTAFALGFAALGAGGVAVFRTHLEAGPVGLLAVGLIFLIIGLSGTLPNRLKVGDNEATWEMERQAVETFVERVAEDIPIVNQREFLGALSDLAEDAPRFATPMFTALAYERLVTSMLEDAVNTIAEDATLPAPVVNTETRYPNVRLDALISTADDRNLIVELKVSQRAYGRDILRQLQVYRSKVKGLSGALLVSKYPVRGSDLLTQEPYTYYVVVEGREDQNELTKVIRRAFNDLAKVPRDGDKA